MALYSYKARDMNGLLIMGQMDADTPDPVRERLAEQGLIPLSVVKGSAALSQNLSLDIFKKVDGEELMLFTRQLHTLFKAGMDIATILSTLGAQTKNKYFADVIQRVKGDVSAGSTLARACSQHPKVFSELYTNMLEAGEEAGILDEVLGHLSNLIEKEITMKNSVSSALLYPKIVMFVLLIAGIVILTFVVPKFTSFYGSFKAELPLPTRIMIASSAFIRGYWYIALAGFGGIVFAYKKFVSTNRGRGIVDRLKWKIPVFGALGEKVANARYSHIVGSLYRAGLPITRALEITAKTIDNVAFAYEVQLVKSDVEKGRGIAESMRHRLYFSPLVIEATAIGEKSGAIDELYHSIGNHFDVEVARTLKNLATLLEPFLLFIVFGMVTLFVLSIFLPMMNIGTAVLGNHGH